MDLPDVNVLIYAFREDSPYFPRCHAWLAELLAGDTRFGISPLTLSALVRITTNTRTFEQASSHSDAFGFCEGLMAHPLCELIEPGERHWGVFRRLCEMANITG